MVKNINWIILFSMIFSSLVQANNSKLSAGNNLKLERINDYFKVTDLEKNKIIYKTTKMNYIIDFFWMSDCQFAVLLDQNKHGGKINVFTIDQIDKCQKVKISMDEVPSNSSPLLINKMGLNYWAYYKNGSREVINWIGTKNYYNFHIGKYPHFYFQLEGQTQLVFRGNQKTKKIAAFKVKENSHLIEAKGSTVTLENESTRYYYSTKTKKIISEEKKN